MVPFMVPAIWPNKFRGSKWWAKAAVGFCRVLIQICRVLTTVLSCLWVATGRLFNKCQSHNLGDLQARRDAAMWAVS